MALSITVQEGEMTMKAQPLVSVSLLTYNHQAFIAASIESVLSQDYDNLEIVIGDDCSQDNTWAIVQQYQRNYPDKIKAFCNEPNLGITGNSNEILKRCTGKYIAIFSGDDLCLPGKISKQVEVMERDQSVVLCYHDMEVFNSEDDKTLRYWNHGPNSSRPIIGDAERVAKAVVEKGTSFMGAMAIMARMDSIPTTGFDKRVPVASDWLMWIEILANGGRAKKVEYLPDVLVRHRRHGSNVTGTNYNHASDEFMTLAIVESKYPSLARSVDKRHAGVRYCFGIKMICDGNLKVGRSFLLLSLRSRWVSWKIFYWLSASYSPFLLRLRNSK